MKPCKKCRGIGTLHAESVGIYLGARCYIQCSTCWARTATYLSSDPRRARQLAERDWDKGRFDAMLI